MKTEASDGEKEEFRRVLEAFDFKKLVKEAKSEDLILRVVYEESETGIIVIIYPVERRRYEKI